MNKLNQIVCTNEEKELEGLRVIEPAIYVEYRGLCDSMITQEMTNPLKFDLTLERKRQDYQEIKLELSITELLAPERLERRAYFDNKNYHQNYNWED